MTAKPIRLALALSSAALAGALGSFRNGSRLSS